MEDRRTRNDQGQFEQEHDDTVVIAAVRKHEPAGTSEVANELEVTRQSADYRLRKLHSDDRVQKKKIGNTLVWSVQRLDTPEDGE
jgi:predicted ArsR family transcriptional regulator